MTPNEKKGRVQLPKAPTQQTALRPTAAPVNTFVQVGATPDVSSNTARLANALSDLNPALGQLGAQMAQAKRDEQADRLAYYVDMVRRDRSDGTISAAQVKEVLPELVPTIAVRVANSLGENKAREWTSQKVQEILSDDALRLDSTKRRAAIEAMREEARGIIGENPDYGTGFLNQFERTVSTYEQQWMQETAAYHEKAQMDAFSNQVADTIAAGGDLLELDTLWAETSSLNPLQRNTLVVDSVMNKAMAEGNEYLLKMIPEQFLSPDAKQKLEAAERQIKDVRHVMKRRDREEMEHQRDMSIRDGKSGILKRVSAGENVNPSEFYKTPELYEYAMRMNMQETVSPVASRGAAAKFRQAVLAQGTISDTSASPLAAALNERGEITLEGLTDYVMTLEGVNPNDRMALIEELPTLINGVEFVTSPEFNTLYNQYLGSALDAHDSSYFSVFGDVGINVHTTVRQSFDTALRQGVMDYIEEHGTVPVGEARRKIREEALASGKDTLKWFQSNIENLARVREMLDEGYIGPNRKLGGAAKPAASQTQNAQQETPPTRRRVFDPSTGTFKDA